MKKVGNKPLRILGRKYHRNSGIDMEEKITRRGFFESDAEEFSEGSIGILKKSAEEIRWLLDRGYPMSSVSAFVGNRYLLSSRQRIALSRALSATADIEKRKHKEVFSCDGETVHMDAFNLIITLEVALSRSTIIKCMDGTIRDLAGLRGTYKIIDKTDTALFLIGEKLKSLNISGVIFYLDAPVSNTGKLKVRILELLSGYAYEVSVKLENKVDMLLKNKSHVITSDAIILNECISWINLADSIISEKIPYAKYVDFC
jgi:hypothetical protein